MAGGDVIDCADAVLTFIPEPGTCPFFIWSTVGINIDINFDWLLTSLPLFACPPTTNGMKLELFLGVVDLEALRKGIALRLVFTLPVSGEGVLPVSSIFGINASSDVFLGLTTAVGIGTFLISLSMGGFTENDCVLGVEGNGVVDCTVVGAAIVSTLSISKVTGFAIVEGWIGVTTSDVVLGVGEGVLGFSSKVSSRTSGGGGWNTNGGGVVFSSFIITG